MFELHHLRTRAHQIVSPTTNIEEALENILSSLELELTRDP